jgi:putative hydrolase of the HAD superfamily
VAATAEAEEGLRYRAVVFDLWDTLVMWPVGDHGGLYGLMADRVGIAPDRFSEAWLAAYDQRATGPLEPSVRSVCSELGLAAENVPTLIDVRLDFTREALVPREGALDVLDELRRLGLKLGLISVCSEEVPQLWKATPLAERIDEAVFSCSVGVAKPDPRIYAIAAEQLGVEPADCLFVDDQPPFVEGALAAGMDAVLIGDEPWDGPRIERLDGVLQLVE